MKESSGSTPSACAACIQRSSSATCLRVVITSQATARRARLMPSSPKRSSKNMSAFWSAMPTSTPVCCGIMAACAGDAPDAASAASRRAIVSAATSVARRGVASGIARQPPVRTVSSSL